MKLVMQRRAEIALRSLESAEQKQITRALDELDSAVPASFNESPKIYKLLPVLGEKIYVYRGSKKLRLILSVKDDICTVEDIIDSDRLDRLLLH